MPPNSLAWIPACTLPNELRVNPGRRLGKPRAQALGSRLDTLPAKSAVKGVASASATPSPARLSARAAGGKAGVGSWGLGVG